MQLQSARFHERAIPQNKDVQLDLPRGNQRWVVLDTQPSTKTCGAFIASWHPYTRRLSTSIAMPTRSENCHGFRLTECKRFNISSEKKMNWIDIFACCFFCNCNKRRSLAEWLNSSRYTSVNIAFYKLQIKGFLYRKWKSPSWANKLARISG